MTTLSLPSTSFLLLECHGPKNSTNSSRITGSVSMVPVARSQFQPQRRRNLGTSNRNPSFSWMATVGEKVQSSTVPTSVPVRVALELLQAGHRYLDVRTPEEFSDGHAAGAINVPYMFKIGSGMTKNPSFLEEVLEHFGKDDEIIVGCQLGKRSFMAASDLLAAGFTGVTDIAGGYAAWTENGLPTES
ncbi:thiosulfate sulfurtransferase 16, chloroplastic-like isoform X1 [Lycium ferocissimum]|uniref:thiosulfate sulfurtransferase 16, chloroplastic-like isoform X1 n=1 Tax=Lycium ferocissimum TaxID=112874 RepID=UPI002814EDD9|nr:thiosulfate sulfurtransferase 16, chloroplastic-like isoform X1 [Lycium ferocissimum]